VHSARDADGYGERAETYLRLLAESALRQADDFSADRVRRATEILIDAGVVSEALAAQVLADLQLARRVRGGGPEAPVATRRLRRVAGVFQPGQGAVLASRQVQEPWRVLPAAAATPGARLMALILIADRALAPATLYLPPSAVLPEPGAPPFSDLTGTDDLGTRYLIFFADGAWVGSAWTGTVMFRPAPPPAARWLAISGPNGQLLRVDITAAPAGAPAHRAALEPVPESPGERLLTRQAERMLAARWLGYSVDHSQHVAETVGTLEGAGALSPLSPAPARLAALGQLLGLRTEGPTDEVPARWTEVLAQHGRRRRPSPVAGTAAIGVPLPELDGVRFAIAGLHSGPPGSFLHVIASELLPVPRRHLTRQLPESGFSWWARDDAGGWHLGVVEDVRPVGGPEGLLRLALLPPLGHPTGMLTLQVSGLAQRVTVELPVRW